MFVCRLCNCMWNCCKRPPEAPYDDFMKKLEIQHKKETNQLKLEESLLQDTDDIHIVTIYV